MFKHLTDIWIVFASNKKKSNYQSNKILKNIPSNKFVFTQFSFSTNIKLCDNLRSTLLWITITTAIICTSKIVLKRYKTFSIGEDYFTKMLL